MTTKQKTRFFYIVTDAGGEALKVLEWKNGEWIESDPAVYHGLTGTISLDRVLIGCVPTWKFNGFYREIESPTSYPREEELLVIRQELFDNEDLTEFPAAIGFFAEAA